MDLCDTLEGIQQYLEDDLEGFNRLLKDRAELSKTRRLNKFYIRGRWVVDTFGQCCVIRDPPPVPVPLVVENIWDYLPKGSVLTESFRVSIPDITSLCPVCNLGWSLDTAHDVYLDQASDFSVLKHQSCYTRELEQKTLEHFQKAFSEATPSGEYLYKAIPNEYCRCFLCTPWYEVRSPGYKGFIKVGWRKRVIVLDWSANGALLWATLDDVTKGPNFVHAWGYAKMSEYLKALLPSMLPA